jgi:O-antigen/teichoic acid export membrane protein
MPTSQPSSPATRPEPSPTGPARNSLFHLLKPVTDFSTSETARKGQLSAIDQAVISAANFLATILLARFITPTQLGVYAVGFTAIFFVRAVQEGVIIQPLNAMGAVLELPEFRRYVSTTGIFQLGIALTTALAVALLGWILTTTGNDTAGPAMATLWFALLAWQLQEYLRRLFYTCGEVWRAVLNTILSSLVRLGFILYLGFNGRLSGAAGIHAIGLGSLAAFGLGFWQARRYWTPHLLDLRQTWTQNWGFGRWILGGTVANWFTIQFYPVLTAGMIDFAAAGAFQVLQNLVAPVHVLLRASDTFLTPRIARIFHRDGYPRLRRILTLTYLVVGLPVIGLLLVAVIFARPLLEMLTGTTYLAYSNGVVILAVFYALWYAYWPLQTVFKAIRRSRPIFLANLLAIVSMFTFGLWAIRTWGVYGTMTGQAVNALIVNVVLWAAWLRQAKKN